MKTKINKLIRKRQRKIGGNVVKHRRICECADRWVFLERAINKSRKSTEVPKENFKHKHVQEENFRESAIDFTQKFERHKRFAEIIRHQVLPAHIEMSVIGKSTPPIYVVKHKI